LVEHYNEELTGSFPDKSWYAVHWQMSQVRIRSKYHKCVKISKMMSSCKFRNVYVHIFTFAIEVLVYPLQRDVPGTSFKMEASRI